jgi:hypothetical protein
MTSRDGSIQTILWRNDAGEDVQRPADAIHVNLWRQLQQCQQALGAANKQLADIISADRARVTAEIQIETSRRIQERIGDNNDWKDGTLT